MKILFKMILKINLKKSIKNKNNNFSNKNQTVTPFAFYRWILM